MRRRLARREFGATGFWNRDALVALAGRVLWAYPRAWATAEVRVGAGVGESQV